jgi:hypothetical protein
MMDALVVSEREKYRAVWGDTQYRVISPGARHLDSAVAWMAPEPGASFTDWGCGTGRAADMLFAMGHTVRLVDHAGNAYVGALPFVEACLWDLPSDLPPTQYGFCADVMEHIPTTHVDDVLAAIALRTVKKCYFQIALFHDTHFTKNGPLHLTVRLAEWWMETIEQHFAKAEYRKVKLKHLLVVAHK